MRNTCDSKFTFPLKIYTGNFHSSVDRDFRTLEKNESSSTNELSLATVPSGKVNFLQMVNNLQGDSGRGYYIEMLLGTPSQTNSSPSSDKILLLGDFNIHVDSPSSPLVTDFNMILDCLGLSQSVNVPTPTQGYTLDLLIPRGLDVSNLSVSDISLSDHFLITANNNLPAPSTATDTVVSFHTKNLLIPLKLSECVYASPLTGKLPSSVDDAVTLYNATLTHIIDTVAPLTTRTVKKD
ncbi:UNVERIFIED_CONTAM: hypothetical protein FKN15_047798 [Acipenser sinensis]